ncbi:hypothetical protein EP073_02980 [Geovibrio thiophilus]|uniref:Protein-export chaperone SecB n=1 Tax=Geovibrio thiophilus TaxID=139438 RepID=A0A410JWG7_9BACT|nr:protein-export chaperone SecB [Geovibrio thiophilus]QAR32399.1 hypothetical protein EP073_02980 [Geovibrio thiophilus]
MKLKMENIIFPNIRIIVAPDVYKRVSKGKNLNISIKLKNNHVPVSQKGKNYQVQMDLSIENKEKDLIIEAIGVASFLLDELQDEEQKEFALNVNCCAIMFPYIREKITYLTQSAGLEPLILESFNFVDRYNKSKQQEESDT